MHARSVADEGARRSHEHGRAVALVAGNRRDSSAYTSTGFLGTAPGRHCLAGPAHRTTRLTELFSPREIARRLAPKVLWFDGDRPSSSCAVWGSPFLSPRVAIRFVPEVASVR